MVEGGVVCVGGLTPLVPGSGNFNISKRECSRNGNITHLGPNDDICT